MWSTISAAGEVGERPTARRVTLRRVWCGVLGTLAVRSSGGEPLTIAGPARRLLLAALISRAGRSVSPELLVEDLWGHVPPRTAAKTLQSHVVRLRDDLKRDEALVTDRTGYRLELGTEDVDASAFELGVRRAGEHAASGAFDLARNELDAALALWRGDAYEEFADAPFCVAERLRLAELRAFAEEEHTDAALRLGEAGELIAHLEKRLALAPYRERTWEQLVVALYRAGRQADALGAFRRARTVLADDLGVDPGPQLQELEQQILQQDPKLLAAAPARRAVLQVTAAQNVCPYLGLASYGESDGALFVGRERLTAELVGLLADNHVVAVVGASGTGKSSLLRAGLVPALRGGALPGSAAWRVSVLTPADATEGRAIGDPDVLVLDQAEDMFSQLPAPARADLVGRLDEYLGSGGRLVFALRADFYGRLTEVQPLASYAQAATALIGPLREDELRRVLVEPAERVGLVMEPELIDVVMDDVSGQPAALPLLSVALVRTWENRDGSHLTLDGYRRGGGVASALESAAEDAYAQLDEPQRVVARRLLVRMATREGGTWVRRSLRRVDATVGAESEAVLGAFAAARLVTVGEQRVDITHDALLAHWSRLRGWLDERALAAELLDHLAVATRAWEDADRPDSDLYRGPRLQSALDWRNSHPDDISAVEADFLDASGAAADAELIAARARAQREEKGRRRLRSVAIGLAAMVVLAAVGVAVALHERSSADRSAARARTAALAADSRRLAALSANAPDIATSSLLAVASFRLQDSADSRGALLSAVERNQSALWRLPTAHRVLRIAATPDGSRLAIIDNRRDVHMIDPRTRRQVGEFAAQADTLDGITSDGRQLITYGTPPGPSAPTGTLAVLDVSTRHRVVVTTHGVMNPEIEPVTGPDGRWVALPTTEHLHGNSVVDVFDSRNWSAHPLRIAVSAKPVSVALGRDTVAVELADGSVEVRQLPSLRVVGRIAHTFAVGGDLPPLLAISPDGSRIGALDIADQRKAGIFRVAGGGKQFTPLPPQPGEVTQLKFSPDGAELGITSLSGSVAVYDASDGSQIETLPGHAGPALALAWTGSRAPTGLYTVGLDSEVVSWSVTSAARLVAMSGPTIAYPDRAETFGHYLLGLTPQQGNVPENQIRMFRADLATGQWASWPAHLRGDEYVNQAMASRDGSRALISVQDQAGHNHIDIWDLQRHVRIGHLALPADAPSTFPIGFDAAISPDGRTAYSSLGATRVGVFALPSGRYLRSYQIHFAGPDGARVLVVPWRFDPNGRLLMAGYDTGPHEKDGPYDFGPNDARPSDQRIAVVDAGSGRILAQTGLGDIIISSVSEWSHDGRLLALGTIDGTLTLYNAATLAVVARGGAVEPGYVSTATFAPDDRTLVTSGTSGSINFWSVPALDRIAQPLKVNATDATGTYAFYAPNGDVVGFVQSTPGTSSDAQRWFDLKAQPAQLARTACALAGADITRAQWARYVGDRPYRHVCR